MSHLGGLWRLCLLVLALGCSDSRSQGEQCVFNDDCQNPLVCAARRCRVQCRTDRDCPSGQLCIPSENPTKRVCVAPQERSLCGGDGQCPVGATCLDNACWWRCRDDSSCAARSAGSCQTSAFVCDQAVTALTQRELPPPFPGEVSGDAAAPADVASSLDAAVDAPALDAPTGVDVVSAPDAPVGVDASVVDRAPFDAPACTQASDCPFANAEGLCAAGRCAMGACRAGFGDCDLSSENGCEATLATDLGSCGLCGRRCLQGPNVAQVGCSAGRCVLVVCAAGFADCNGDVTDGCEVDTRVNTQHCGACGSMCPAPDSALSAVCVAGQCGISMCRSGRADCDGLTSNGCETDVTSSIDHCGACRTACPRGVGATPGCVAGSCTVTCVTGRGDCNRVPADGCEAEFAVDPENCGACGAPCGREQVCLTGRCQPWSFPAASTDPVFDATTDQVLPSGVHRFASFRVRAGVTVRVTSPGVLEIFSRGEIRIEGTIDVSGGPGGNGAAGEGSDCGGGGGAGGETGTTRTGSAVAGSCAPGQSGTGLQGANGVLFQRGCGGGGNFGGGAGGSPGPIGNALCGGGGGGGGGYAGGGGGGGFGNAANGGAGAGEGTGDIGAFGSTQAGGGGGGFAGGGVSMLWLGARGQSGSLGGIGEGGGGGGGGGIASRASLDPGMLSTFRPGSGGGGGGAWGSRVAETTRCTDGAVGGGGGGGGGGGALRLASATRIVVPPGGRVLANGGAGGSITRFVGVTSSGAGGGGSGGAVHLAAPAIDVLGAVSAQGGLGGGAPNVNRSGGGNGGAGRILVTTDLSRCARGGQWSPQWPADQCTASPDISGTLAVRALP